MIMAIFQPHKFFHHRGVDRFRLLVEEGRKARDTFSQLDLIIAATALVNDLTVVSRDTADYERARVHVLNPWTAA
jgi:predicted nucleic acid-binding protein